MARTFEFWDRPTRTRIAEFDFERLRGETNFPYVVQTEQHKLANMAIARLRQLPNAEVVMGCEVTAVEQDAGRVTLRSRSVSAVACRRISGIAAASHRAPRRAAPIA